ncbi:hypothetical protein EMCRGX_G018272 [Ephydatia muelleri]
MLHISLETLQRAAIYGAFLSVTGCSVLYYLIQRNLASSPCYTKALRVAREHEKARRLLGEPLRFQALKLRDRENVITAESAHLLIPVYGSKAAGFLRTTAIHQDGDWKIESIVLEFKGRPQKVVLLAKDQTK